MRARAREGCALRHAAGHLARALVGRVVEADQVQQLAHAFTTGTTSGAAWQAELDVLGDRAPRKQPGLLECDGRAFVDVGDERVIEADAAPCRCVQAADEAKQGRLSAPGGSDHGDDLARGDVEVHSAQHVAASARQRKRSLDSVEPDRLRGSHTVGTAVVRGAGSKAVMCPCWPSGSIATNTGVMLRHARESAARTCETGRHTRPKAR